MQILSFNFLMYTLGGVWRPVEWSSSFAKLLYNAFTVYTIVSLYIFVLAQFVDIVLIINNMDDFMNSSLLFVSVIAVCCKATIIVLRRNSIIDLMEMLLRDPYRPRDENELAIQARFDEFIQSCSIKYSLLVTISMTTSTLRSLLNVVDGHLPHRAWLPYDLNKSRMFLITTIHQIVTIFLGALINIGTETAVFGLILQTCAQLDILKSRLNKSVITNMTGYQEDRLFSPTSRRQAPISDLIRHHLSIYIYANKVNSVFSQILFVQFFVSILALCTSVYYVSTHIGETEAAGILAYTISMFVQIFVYCWSGNEVTLKSASLVDAVYHIDWSSLSIGARKDLLMIMIRSAVPIKFTSSYLITMSLESYGNILKMSYSAFSVLQSLGGVWRPVEWSSSCAKLLYNALIVCVIVALYLMVLTQFLDMLLVVDNIDDFTNNSLMFVSIISVCCKATIAVIRRDRIIGLVQTLLREPYKPRNEDELTIQATFDRFIRSYSIKYALLAGCSVTSVTYRSVMNVIEGHLPYRVWLPYDSNGSPMFLITSIHQIVTVIFATFINIGTETLVFGLILQTCAQLDILKNRLNKSIINRIGANSQNQSFLLLNRKQATISEHIRHHLHIYTYARKVNKVFNEVLFIQFFGSILVFCTSVYYLSAHLAQSEAAGIVVYIICMFVQIFLYCWSGNEVILKVRQSVGLGDAMYHTDWTSLSLSERKDLLMIMKCSMAPIKFTSSFLITLSLESYSSILKTSYSAFNVLQQS
ncbi:PREDICTED: uncharacterized protein LOC106750174 [Dinoponera quadriceps]|uniref:Uncharacterized protein LOC106750174 n=1 Tax=Dinoponera quadriceps TaxID=609295 RepID=A0A6P3Y6Y2_DINQU|nr:PREDICTED: uncharacterized protein LOC106750174 [Dinoponera quadriceps]